MKPRVRALLEEGRVDEVARLAEGAQRVFGTLVSLTYDADPLVAWRAIDAMAGAAERVGRREPHRVREQLRRLLWLNTEESGGICWRAPEAMAEIVSRLPHELGDYVPIVSHFLVEAAEEDLEHFRSGMLWALGRLGPLARDEVGEDVLSLVVAALDHPEARVRGTAAWCLGRLGHLDPLRARAGLLGDDGAVDFYEAGRLSPRPVKDVVRAALSGSA